MYYAIHKLMALRNIILALRFFVARQRPCLLCCALTFLMCVLLFVFCASATWRLFVVSAAHPSLGV